MESNNEVKSTKRIGGVKLILGGLKGLEVNYETVDVQEGMSYAVEHNDKRHKPVSRDIKDLIQGLKDDFLELTGYAYAVEDDGYVALKMCTEITGIIAGTDKFVITGKIRSWEDKVVGLATPAIKESDAYDRFDEVIKAADTIYKEVDLYMKGKKIMGRKEIIEDYVRQTKHIANFSYKDFETGTVEEQEKLLAEIKKDLMLNLVEENGEVVVGVEAATGDDLIERGKGFINIAPEIVEKEVQVPSVTDEFVSAVTEVKKSTVVVDQQPIDEEEIPLFSDL